METERRLKRALSAIEDARSALVRAKHKAEDSSDIRRAISELDDAETHIRKAIRELPRE